MDGDSAFVYFLRRVNTQEYYRRRGGRRTPYGPNRGAIKPTYGPLKGAAAWTTIRGPQSAKGNVPTTDKVEIVAVSVDVGDMQVVG